MFETTLIASRRQKGLRQRLLALPAAIAIHGLAVTFFVVGQLWATGPVPEPALVVGFYQPPPPPPPAARGTVKPPNIGGTRPPKPDAPPTAVPETAPVPLPAGQSEPAGNGQDGVVGGDPDGEDVGVIGGVKRDQGTPTEARMIEEPPVRIGGEIDSPVLLRRIDPRYPEIARRAKVQGVVILEAIIDRDGHVVEGRILRDIGLGCGEAALDAIRGWRYVPATLNGRTISVYLTITVNFQLS